MDDFRLLATNRDEGKERRKKEETFDRIPSSIRQRDIIEREF